MSKAVKKFECPVCYSRNDSESDAIKCCIENIEVVYECGTCGACCDSSEDAAMCCLGDCPKCGKKFCDDDVESECDLGFDPVYHCTQCGWRTGDSVPATPSELEQAGQGRIVE